MNKKNNTNAIHSSCFTQIRHTTCSNYQALKDTLQEAGNPIDEIRGMRHGRNSMELDNFTAPISKGVKVTRFFKIK